MIIKPDEFERWAGKVPPQMFIFLFHGTDTGLIHERAKRMARLSLSGGQDAPQLVRIHGDALASDRGRLADETGSIGLFGDERVIWIEAGGKNFTEQLTYQIENPPEKCRIVIEGGNLKPAAPLRKLLDSAKAAASVGCYPDTVDDLKRLVDSTMRLNNLSIDAETRDYLVSRLGNDRLITRSELEKLCLFCLGTPKVTISHINEIMDDASAMAMDQAIDAAFAGQRSKVEQNCSRVFETGGDATYLLTATLSHALRLHQIKLELANGGNIDSLMTRSGIFYQRKQIVTAYLARWSPDALLLAIKALQDCISRTRQHPRLSEILAIRVLWSISGMVSAGRR